MSEHLSGDWLTEQELCAELCINRYYLRRVRRWLFLEPGRTFPGRGSGSESRYPPVAVPMIRRFRERQHETRNTDECFWGVWLDEFPLNIGKWADTRLERLQIQLNAIQQGDDENLLRAAIDASATTPTRTSTRRPIHNRLQLREEVSLNLWAVAVAAGLLPAKSLYDPASPSLAALNQAAGFDGKSGPPDPELRVENFSIAQMRAVLAGASNSEMEQSRRDCKKISEIVAASRGIDWHAVRKALDVQRTSSAQPPAPFEFLVSMWRNFDFRAAILFFLVWVRRSPQHSINLSEILAVAAGALERFPKLNSAGNPATDRAP